jgi:hypothetical protein
MTGWPERTETRRSIKIYNKYTKSALVGSCHSHCYEDARKTFNKIAKHVSVLKYSSVHMTQSRHGS